MRKYPILLLLIFILAACGPGASSTVSTPSKTPKLGTSDGATRESSATDTQLPPPDLTGETLIIYHLGDSTSEFISPLIVAVQDMVASINTTGGIFGAQLELQFFDTGGLVENVIQGYQSFVESDEDIALLIVYSYQDQEALFTRVVEDRVPVLVAVANTTALYGLKDGFIFSLSPTFPDQFAYFMDYLSRNWAQIKPPAAGDEIKIAYLSWPDGFGQAAYTNEVLEYANTLNIAIVLNQTFEAAPVVDMTTPIISAQKAGANVIYTNTYAFGPGNMLNDLNHLGLRENFVVASSFFGLDLATSAYLLKPDYAQGLYAPFPSAWWSDEAHPAIEFALQINAEYGRVRQQQTVGRLLHLGLVDLARYALEQAVLDVGVNQLNGEAVYQALTRITGLELLHGLLTVDFTGGRRAPGQMRMRIIQGDRDTYIPLEEYTEIPDLRPDR
ncbi:MAG: ABC transporter substrate-binding protein [Anaerolineae bacterium]|nr:ABC transporter substrate-binding protein [Anaerolineae bacterium]